MKNWKIIVIAFVAVIGVWLLGYFAGREREPSVRVETETIVKTDTIREYIPVEVAVERTEKVLIEVRDTIRVHDTLYVALPFEKKFYKSDEYYAEISGYKPRLDYIEVYAKTETITKTQTIVKEPAWDFAIELGLDYMVSARQPMLVPNIGASIGYKRLSIHAEAGLEFGEIVRPYYGTGVRFKLVK